MFKQLAALFATLAFYSATPNAALISHHGYTLDTTTDIVTDGTLEWLQWDFTDGMSITQALATVAGVKEGGGWELASNDQMANLFNVFGQCRLSWSNTEAGWQSCNTPADAGDSSTDLQVQFVALFGDTYTEYTGDTGSADQRDYSSALYGSDTNNNGFYKRVTIFDDYILWSSPTIQIGFSQLTGENFLSTYSQLNLGVALVRAAGSRNQELPLPATLGLMALGLLCLRLTQRTKATSSLPV